MQGINGTVGIVPDASLCIDAFSPIKLGNQLQVWSCNGSPQQMFEVNWGTTIRLNQNIFFASM